MSGAWSNSKRRKELPPDWPSITRQVLREDPTCYVCHFNASVQVDHIARGNDHSRGNLAGICVPCHKRKSAKEGNEARRPQEREGRRPLGHPGISS